MTRKGNWLIFVLTLALISIVPFGCAEPKQSEDQVKSYGNDGYLGLTNTNPRLPTNPTSSYQYNQDINLVSQTLEGIDEVEKYQVRIRGGELHVKIYLSDQFNRSQIETIEQNVYRQLAYMLPRYDILLTSNQSDIKTNEAVKQ